MPPRPPRFTLLAAFLALLLSTARSSAPAPLSLASFLSIFSGRCLYFSGDSTSREMTIALLRWAWDCQGEVHAPARFAGRRRHEVCADLARSIKHRGARVTAIPVDAHPERDIVVRWSWAPMLSDLQQASTLRSELARAGGCFLVLNSGLWEARGRRLKTASARLKFGRRATALASALAAAAGKRPNSSSAEPPHLLWRDTLPVERTSEFPGASLYFVNLELHKALDRAGIRHFDLSATWRASPPPRTTDGVHPKHDVHVRMLRVLLAVLAAQLEAAGDTVPPPGQRAALRMAEFALASTRQCRGCARQGSPKKAARRKVRTVRFELLGRRALSGRRGRGG